MRRVSWCFAVLLMFGSRAGFGQQRSAVQLHALVQGLTVTTRVLIIGASPRDADADLIAWLARGRSIQTGYLALTRGESAANYTGLETGATLGAVHVQEALSARAIDGGELYFTRAFDFGPARNAEEAFKEWDRNTLLGDVVSVVRAFRPHVIIALSRSDTTAADGQQQAAAILARDVFDAALDTARFSVAKFGMPWTPQSLFEPGTGFTIDSREYDRILGLTYAEVATESRAQLRSFGFESQPWAGVNRREWKRIATRVADTLTTTTSIFSGIDTTFGRLQKELPLVSATAQRPLITQIPGITAYADSARQHLDLANPGGMIPYLREVVDLASAARVLLRGCRHPARDAAASFSNTKCEPQWLDLDASLDLVLHRASDALIAASGVSWSAVSDREFLATDDTAHVAVTVFNNSRQTITLNDVSVTGAIPVRMTLPIRISTGDSARVERFVVNMPFAHPWWIFKRDRNFYPGSISALDGVPRPAIFMRDFGISGVALPENIRRLSDANVTLTIARTTLTSSVGPVVAKTADPILGVRDRALSGTPKATLVFERALEWAQAGPPLKKTVSLVVRSFSERSQQISLKAVPGPGGALVRIDSVPPRFTLAPHESREVSIFLRGKPAALRYDLGIVGVSGADTLRVGFRTAQYPYLPPLHFFREATVSVQAIAVEIPRRLTIAYVRGAGDDTDLALKGLGIPAYALNNEGLMRFDLDALSTVVVGPEAFRVDPGLLTQMPRLMEFARKGGTVVIMNNPAVAATPSVLPFPVSFSQPYAEQVMRSDAVVAMPDAKSRILTWPNVIRDDDFANWVGARSLMVPTTVDVRYSLPVEMHDRDRKQNRNSILVAAVGKGRVIYTSLTLTQQIANAVPGAMRLFVNLLSAGIPAEVNSVMQ